jgi:hypothetical protein
MRDTIQSILATEVERLKRLSDAAGLELDDVRKLDLLIKAHKSFQGESSTREPTEADAPAEKSVDELLEGLVDRVPPPV